MTNEKQTTPAGLTCKEMQYFEGFVIKANEQQLTAMKSYIADNQIQRHTAIAKKTMHEHEWTNDTMTEDGIEWPIQRCKICGDWR